MTQNAQSEQKTHPVISHNMHPKNVDDAIKTAQDRIRQAKDLTFSTEKTLALLQQLAEFDLGKFLLKNQGLNGYWTAYCIVHAPHMHLDHPLENWLINKAPVLMATQERFHIFEEQLKKYVRSGMRVASIPCGLMDDLLRVKAEQQDLDIELVGIDKDQESLRLARENAEEYGLSSSVQLREESAWALSSKTPYDIILSNGLNIYEPDYERVTDLYRNFHKALKQGGILITSFLTPPPALDKSSPWQNINSVEALKQKAVLADALAAKWRSYRTEEETRKQLADAGFEVFDVLYDHQHIFPTIIARKA